MKVLVFSLILLMQACGLLLAQTSAPVQPESPGILGKLVEKTREVKTKVQDMGEPVLDFFGAYYDDHIAPVTDPYIDWASGISSSFWEKIQTTIENFMP